MAAFRPSWKVEKRPENSVLFPEIVRMIKVFKMLSPHTFKQSYTNGPTPFGFNRYHNGSVYGKEKIALRLRVLSCIAKGRVWQAGIAGCMLGFNHG